MTFKQKIIFVALFSLIVAMASCAAFVNYVEPGCDTVIVDQVSSPNKKLKAIIFQLECGATTGFNSQVVIVSGDKNISLHSSLPKSFFVADSDHRDIPASKGGGPELKVLWLSDTNLEIQHHALARVFRADTSSKGVAISYYATGR